MHIHGMHGVCTCMREWMWGMYLGVWRVSVYSGFVHC